MGCAWCERKQIDDSKLNEFEMNQFTSEFHRNDQEDEIFLNNNENITNLPKNNTPLNYSNNKSEKLSQNNNRINEVVRNVNRIQEQIPKLEEDEKERYIKNQQMICKILENIESIDRNTYQGQVLEIINKIRINPAGYADFVEHNKQFITEEKIREKKDGHDTVKTQKIFQRKLKVALNQGESAFDKAIEFLKTTEPMLPLRYKEELEIPLPEDSKELNDPEYSKRKVQEIREKHNLNIYFREHIKNPEIAVLLMIVDDSEKYPGKKRKTLLNKNFSKIAISHRFYNKNFVAYLCFSK